MHESFSNSAGEPEKHDTALSRSLTTERWLAASNLKPAGRALQHTTSRGQLAVDNRGVPDMAPRIRTGLCRHSNQSLHETGNSAGKRFGDARDRGGFSATPSRLRAAETGLSHVSRAKAAET
jgi:hypothetical protein